MSYTKRILFGVVTLCLVLVAMEAAARVVWSRLAARAFQVTQQRGEELLRNDAIHFLKRPDPLYVFTLKEGLTENNIVTTAEGFVQRETVPLARTPGTLRLAALGESTTMEQHVDHANYPVYLRKLLGTLGHGYNGVEVINAGVAAWVSDQVALRAENQVAAYQPDIVLLYVGWNDFQAYDPYRPVPDRSFFYSYLNGSKYHLQFATHLKSVVLLTALYDKYLASRPAAAAAVGKEHGTPEEIYRFYLKNLDRIVAAFQRANPRTRVCLCTLVGRWPLMTDEEHTDPTMVWWMRDHQLSRAAAAAWMDTFNDLIRQYATAHGLPLIDTAAAFAKLDRHRLQWDFAHFSSEGYELLAETMYEALREAGIVQGDKSRRREELLAKYQN